ncbi:MAG: cation:proton antiporter, partial [Candidatus Polarisedimenticolia bacterium]
RLGLPSPVTELCLGALCGPLGMGLVEHSELLQGLAGIGISALFLFAGIEVEVPELLLRRRIILQHLAIQAGLLALATAAGVAGGLSLPVAALLAAAVMSPSAGFIVPALDTLGLPPAMASWIKQKAIGTELMAIAAVLVFSNSGSQRDLLIGLGGMLALLLFLPATFVLFHRAILRWAPRTEFSFVMIVALLAAYVTHHLGVHYLVGAFVVGLAARRYLDWCSARMVQVAPVRQAIHSFRFFSAFFVPFYFFGVGLLLPVGALTPAAFLFAAALVAMAVPLRIASVAVHRRFGLGEPWRDALGAGFLLGPTTVFSLAVAEILRARFGVADWIFGGIVLYGAATSLVPLLSRRRVSTEYEDLLPAAPAPT